MPVTFEYFVGKKRRCFINDYEEQCWWQTDEVRWYDSDDFSTNFAINFFDYNDCSDETPDCFYEVLKLPFVTDYINRDA